MSTPKERKRLERQADLLLGKGKKKARKKKKRTPSSLPSKWAMENRATLLEKDNRAEDHVGRVLGIKGYLYTREFVCRAAGRDRFVDFVVEYLGLMIGIEVDGAQHMTAKGQQADRKRERELMKAGEIHAFIRLSWHEALGLTVDKCTDLIEAAYTSRGVILCY